MSDRPLFAERYEIAAELGRGAYGVVYRARDTRLDRTVALKVLNPAWQADPQATRRFWRETAVLARLEHPAIVPLYDAGEAREGGPFLVMRFLAGGSLAGRVSSTPRPTPARLLAWLEAIAAALDYAHAHDVLHRDLKPTNLLLDEADHVFVADFGLARIAQAEASLSLSGGAGALLGSVHYLAPEVLQGEEHTAASDRYSLGCVLYELLAGRPPFQAGNPMAVLYQHVQAEPAPLTPADPLGRALGEQALRLLAKRPGARPASLAAVVEDLRAAMTPPASLPAAQVAAAAQPAPTSSARTATVTVAPNLPPFALGEGRSVRSVEELVQAAVAKPSDVLWHLGGDPLELWLELIGRADLAKLAAGMKEIQPGGGPAALKRFLDATGVRHTYSGQPAFPFDWVAIPAGPFLMGSDPARDPNTQDAEKPQHRVEVAAFRIARTPVTVAQFAAFVEATAYVTMAEKEKPNEATWRCPGGPQSNVKNKQNHPVTWVSWHDALAFCRWADVRLPTEAEWEKAARGIDGRYYPWGNTAPDEKRCNFDNKVGDTTAVGAYPGGASPFGVLDMAGNVWEWTSTVFKPYPYKAGDGRENPGGDEGRVLRGGAFLNSEYGVRCACRYGYYPILRGDDVGFRVVSPGF